jgi:uncharacterized BrkB/YihY/UPF0761 family membrane protein
MFFFPLSLWLLLFLLFLPYLSFSPFASSLNITTWKPRVEITQTLNLLTKEYSILGLNLSYFLTFILFMLSYRFVPDSFLALQARVEKLNFVSVWVHFAANQFSNSNYYFSSSVRRFLMSYFINNLTLTFIIYNICQ